MTNTTMKFLNLIFTAILICLSTQIGQAQTLGELYSSNQKVEALFIEKDTNMEQALEAMEERFNILFIYRSKIIKDTRVENEIMLTNGLENTLDKLFEGTDLEYANLKHKTYGIYTRKEDSPESLTLSILQETINGRVIDITTGEALPGVNILIEGTSTGTATDVMGEFELTVESLNATLIVSYIGYQNQSIPINGRTEINIELQPMAVIGDDIVVTALGIRRETRSLGYSTVTVDADALTVNRSVSSLQSLQGKVPGVNISSMASGSAGSTKIRIRGQSSFGANNTPLIVVDGVPIMNPEFGRGDNQGIAHFDAGDGLSSINPDNIESMTVLKGGGAAALYGSRAKDGAILITTKNNSGSRGINVTYNSNFTLDRAIDDTDWQYEYGQGEGGVRPTSPWPDSGVWSFGEKIEPGMTQILYDGLEVPYEAQRNRITEFFSGGYTMNNSISLSSGVEGGGFNLTLSQLNNESIVPGSGYDRTNVALGFTQDIFPNLNISGNISYSREEHINPQQLASQHASTPRVLYHLSNTMPLWVMKENQVDENGDELLWSRFRARANPYFTLENYFAVQQRDRVNGNVTVRYNVTDWLYAQGRIGQDYFVRDLEFNRPTGLGHLPPAPSGFVPGEVTQDVRRFREVNADFLLGVDRDITENIGADINFGGNIMYTEFERNSVFAEDFIVRDLYTVENSRQQTNLFDFTERQVNSLYGAANFNYKNYLFLGFTARNDWFSTLSPAERSVLYPSVSSSFVFSDVIELPDWLDLGILRASYAEVGSDTDVAPYSQNIGFSINSSLFEDFGGSNQPLGSIDTNTIPNENLRPMRIKEYEFGLGLQILERVNFDLTYYNKLSIDQIMNAAVSNTSGFTSQLINAGESVNRGVEMLLDITAIEKQNFLWNITFNGSYNTSEVLKLGESDDDISSIGGQTRQIVGLPMGQIWENGYLRDDQGNIVHNPNNGMPLWTVGGMAFGSAIPTWVGGISNSINYKNLGLSALVDFKLGHMLNSQLNFNVWRLGHHKRTLPGREEGVIVGDGVLPDGSPNTIAVPVQQFYESITAGNNREEFIMSAGFWKLRQITIDYDFTSLVSGYLPIRGLVLSAVVNNVLTIKDWAENVDPEQRISTSDTAVGSRIGATLPMTRSFGFNLRVQL